MGCNKCSSDEENMHGVCPECARKQRMRVRASIREKQQDDEEDEGGQDRLDNY